MGLFDGPSLADTATSFINQQKSANAPKPPPTEAEAANAKQKDAQAKYDAMMQRRAMEKKLGSAGGNS